MKRRKREVQLKPEPIKHDPIEDTEEFQSIIEEVNKEAESLVGQDVWYGRMHFIDQQKKRILKEKYQIDWKTTAEMNPDWDFI